MTRAPLSLKIAALAGLAFLHIPLLFILLYAFTTEERSYAFPPPGYTLKWFAVVWERADIWAAVGLSLRVATLATLIALVLGTLAAGALARAKFFGREPISLLFVLPIALPGIVTGIALRQAFGLMEIPFSFWTIVLGHATFCIVVVYNNAVARLRRLSPSLIEASMDLGADAFQTFRLVVLPNVGTALLAGGMLAFALSFDEVIVTTFTAGQQIHAADLDAVGAHSPAAAPRHQRRRRARHRRDLPAHPCRLLSDARGRGGGRQRKIRRPLMRYDRCSSARNSRPAPRRLRRC